VGGLIPLLIPPPLDVPNGLVDGGKMIEADTEMGEKGVEMMGRWTCQMVLFAPINIRSVMSA
jgi:hypothetical protein